MSHSTSITIGGRHFVPMIGSTELAAIADRLAAQIDARYAGRRLTICPVLTGAYMFAADLLRRLTVPAEVHFVKYSSYNGMESSGSVNCQLPFSRESVAGRDVLIVEDVIDSGLSMQWLLGEVQRLEPRSVAVCTLLYKPQSFRAQFEVDFVGRNIGTEFIVGYGMDYDEEGRTLPEVYVLSDAPTANAKNTTT